MTTLLLNKTDLTLDELALIPSEPISTQWTNELRKTWVFTRIANC